MAFPLGKIFQLFLIILLALSCEAKKRPPLDIEPEFRVDEVSEQNALKFELDKCAFYCFFVPLKVKNSEKNFKKFLKIFNFLK